MITVNGERQCRNNFFNGLYIGVAVEVNSSGGGEIQYFSLKLFEIMYDIIEFSFSKLMLTSVANLIENESHIDDEKM